MVKKSKQRKQGARGLQQISQHLLVSSDLDVVYVAFDFEGTNSILADFQLRQRSQVGISIFDTREMRSESPRSVLTTYNFVTADPDYRYGRRYYEKACAKFHFGTPRWIPTNNMLESINQCVPRDRNIVVVAHGGRDVDIKILRHIGFDLKTSIIDIVDTQAIAAELRIKEQELSVLLGRLGFYEGAVFHNGGKDANFTLRALILLALRAYMTRKMGKVSAWRLAALSAIAMHKGGIPTEPRKFRSLKHTEKQGNRDQTAVLEHESESKPKFYRRPDRSGELEECDIFMEERRLKREQRQLAREQNDSHRSEGLSSGVSMFGEVYEI